MPTEQIDPDLVRYAADVAKALNPLRALKVPYGEFYISKVTFGFDNEVVTNIAVAQGEHDALVVEFTA
jgi:hypothetical protein